MNGLNGAALNFFFPLVGWQAPRKARVGGEGSGWGRAWEGVNRLGATLGTGDGQVGTNGLGGGVGAVNELNGWYLLFGGLDPRRCKQVREGTRMGTVGVDMAVEV